METPKSETGVTTGKRKRGRPPIDDYEQTFTTPKVANVGGNAGDDAYSNDAMSSSDHDLSIWEEESGQNEQEDNADGEEVTVKVEVSILRLYWNCLFLFGDLNKRDEF